jgi:MFS family permease
MTSQPASAPTWAVTLAGGLSLAAAMGIGRFAFTPLLPLMAREGQLDVALGGWLAAANYAGYLVGALTAARMPWRAATLARIALAATAGLTAAMALPGVALWLVLRFLAGVASAWVFVATSIWCLGTLARRDRSHAGAWVYASVGFGIAGTGLYCLAAASLGLAAAQLWWHLGALALLLTAPVAWVLARLEPVAGSAAATAAAPARGDGTMRGLVICYGLMGFGYILPATFLPALARSVVDDPRLFGLAWPVFGATAAVSTLLAGWAQRRASRLQIWSVCQFAMGLGVLLPSLALNGFTIAASALLVGGTFIVITLAGVQEVRARAPAEAGRWVARITAAFALGQIAGPATSALLVPVWGPRGLDLALQAGALALFASAAWLWRRTTPHTATQETSNA